MNDDLQRIADMSGEYEAWKIVLREIRKHVADEVAVERLCTTIGFWGVVAAMHSRLHQSDDEAREYLAFKFEQFQQLT